MNKKSKNLNKNIGASNSDEFEILVFQIQSLLENDNAEVVWNKKILDPDNPKRLRQVDVFVK